MPSAKSDPPMHLMDPVPALAGQLFGATSSTGGLVKICGIREPEHAVAAAEAGADLIGFIFAPARRQVTAERAAACIAAAQGVRRPLPVTAVGVFVDAPSDEIAAVVERAGLDVVQLHGGESPEIAGVLPVPVLRVLRPPAGTPATEVERSISAWQRAERRPLAYMLEGYSATAAGGVGARADRGLAFGLARRWPLFLAGGLDPDNVGEAIAEVGPAGVDVSSGVERDGMKNADRIIAFVRAARAAFASLPRTGRTNG